MAIPLALTTLTIQRVTPVVGDDDEYDGYDSGQPAPVTVASGIRATIGEPSASVVLAGGDRVVYSATFAADPCQIEPGDTIIDGFGTTWSALWSRTVFGLGLSHTQGELRLVTGVT
jgi:hypothetical protein